MNVLDFHSLSRKGTDKFDDISKPFSEEEVKKAVWGLAADKAPGDGFPVFFYRKVWNIVKPGLISILNSFHNGSLQLEQINYTFVVPKKGDAKEVGDYRPIRVLNASVKIISNVLTNRLRKVLGD